MGNSLHNKIYLGRRSIAILHTKRAQAMLAIAGFATIGVAWLALRAFQ